MTTKEEKKIQEDYSWAVSKIATKMIPSIKDAFASIGFIDMLMALPIVFKFKELARTEVKADITEADIAVGGYIIRDTERGNPDRLVVHLVLTKFDDKSWDEYFNMLFDRNDDVGITEAAFTYLHEALHLMMRHYDYYLNQSYTTMVQDIRPDMDEGEISELLNHGYDYWINGYLLDVAREGSGISAIKDKGHNLYDSNLAPSVLSQQEIILKLAKEAKISKETISDGAGNPWGSISTLSINGQSSQTINIHNPQPLTDQSHSPDQQQNISSVLGSTRDNMLERTRGEGSVGTLSELGVDYRVPIDWFKHLKGSIFNIVQRYTSHSEPTWGRLKNKFRHVAPMPGRLYYEKELAAVISIDQSGSMSDEDLEKINYVVTQLSKKTVFSEVLLHDTGVASRKRFTQKSPLTIRDFVTKRVACGGTSHKEVFQILEEIKDEFQGKLIYISFSDNWSDIEQVWDADIFKNISAYWITTDEDNTVDVDGMQISLENGLL